jgi:hypothetical protein
MGAVKRPVTKAVAVVTGDIIDSRTYHAAARARLNDALRRAFDAIVPANVALAHLDFRVTAGDEFQFVLGDPERALETVFRMRSRLAQKPMEPMVRFRASIGVGPIRYRPARGARDKPYEWDGPAFVRAREGLERIKRDRWTMVRTSVESIDEQCDVILGLVDELQRGWTAAQWEAVGWTMQGLNRQQAARKLKIKHQNVSKRLGAAGWPAVAQALEYLGGNLSSHPEEGANRNAP